MNTPANTTMNRRKFLKSVGAVATIGYGTALTPIAMAAGRVKSPFATATFVAFLETVIPGPKNDPTGGPGAIETLTPEYLDVMERSKMFPISLKLVQGVIAAALNTMAVATHFRAFHDLEQEPREKLVESLSHVIGMPFFLRLARAPFYVATMNRAGLEWIGLPVPPPNGYERAESSWGVPISEPEAGTVDGNLP